MTDTTTPSIHPRTQGTIDRLNAMVKEQADLGHDVTGLREAMDKVIEVLVRPELQEFSYSLDEIETLADGTVERKRNGALEPRVGDVLAVEHSGGTTRYLVHEVRDYGHGDVDVHYCRKHEGKHWFPFVAPLRTWRELAPYAVLESEDDMVAIQAARQGMYSRMRRRPLRINFVELM